MINYTCVECNIEMKCIKNNIPAIHFEDSNKANGIDALRFGDMYQCPICKTKIVGGFGNQILGMDLGETFIKDLLKEEYVEIKR